MFSYLFNVLIIKIIFKNKKIYYFNTFLKKQLKKTYYHKWNQDRLLQDLLFWACVVCWATMYWSAGVGLIDWYPSCGIRTNGLGFGPPSSCVSELDIQLTVKTQKRRKNKKCFQLLANSIGHVFKWRLETWLN